MGIVRFRYADVNPVFLHNKKEVKDFVASIFRLERREVRELNYIFCSDVYLLNINKTFLRHDYYTDIITFDLSEDERIVGEVYISTETVKDNSKVHHTDYRSELLRVIFHGALHLIGYRDKKKSEITLMRQKEEYYLRLFETK